jgi:hypothetical protein
MTLNKTKGFAVSLVSLGLLAAGMSAPIANAAQVDATIDAIDNCAWQISTGSGQFALTNTNNYVGDALILTAATTYDVILGLAGTNEAPNAVALDSSTTAECSFYNKKADEGITGRNHGHFVRNLISDDERYRESDLGRRPMPRLIF